MSARTLTAAAAALVAAAAGLIIVTTPTADAAPRDGLRVVTANTAGNSLYRVDAMIRWYKPDAVAVQEFCADDLAAFRDRHPGMRVVFSPMTYDRADCGDKGLLLAGPRLRNVAVIPLDGTHVHPRVGTKSFQMICGTVRRRARVCTTHLLAGVPDTTPIERRATRTNQAREIVRALRGHRRATVAGDLNAGPTSSVLRVLRRAGFRIGPDRTPTHSSGRIDHVLHRGGGRIRTDVRPQTTSDHRAVRSRTRY